MKKIRNLASVSLVVSLGVIVTSCGSFSSGDDGTTGSGGTGQGSSGSSSTGGSATSSSGSGNSSSGSSSVSGSSSISGSSSVGGGSSCSGTMCSGACVDTTSDSANCGSCGNACGAGLVCSSGACAATCAAGTTACSGACVDLMTSAPNCGTCGKACATGQVCTGGACACGTGQTSCTGTCTNLMTDGANCGTCGKACAAGQTCSAGVCGGSPPPVGTVCDVLSAAGSPCVAAHSTTRVLVSGYTGPLYQVCNGAFKAGPSSCTSGQTKDIGSVDGYADAATQDSFCAGGSCTISFIYDQTTKHNDLEPAPAGGTKKTPDNPVNATDAKTTLNGHEVYGVLIKANNGYRSGCTNCNIKTPNGTALGDSPETEYMVTSSQNLIDECCFDYGNAEKSGNDDNNGTMDALYFGGGVIWGTGSPGGHNNGPWVMADLENGLYAGWANNSDQNIPGNTPLMSNFITAALVGDSCTGATGCAGTGTSRPNGRFALYGGDATTGMLSTKYDGPRPYPPGRTGYVPMKKTGSIILGTGGDNSSTGGGRWFEGVMTTGAASVATLNAVQANIVAAKYGQ